MSAAAAAAPYARRVYAVPAGAEGELVARLAEAGTLGIEELPAAAAESRLAAYFAAGPHADVTLPAGARLLEETSLPAADWLAGYRAAALPLAVGERLLLDPREPTEPAPDVPAGRILLRVPARSAFGTGSHATTRLALRLLERQALAGARLLDIGAGSGVLSLAALALGCGRAVGLDLDPSAALLAGQHARLNHLSAAFWAGGLAALDAGAGFDLVIVNALPHEVLPEAPRIAAAVAAGGRLVVSGVLAEEAAPALAAWAGVGLRPLDAIAEEEWVAWTLSCP